VRNFSPWQQWMIRLAGTTQEDPFPEHDMAAIAPWRERREQNQHSGLCEDSDIQFLDALDQHAIEPMDGGDLPASRGGRGERLVHAGVKDQPTWPGAGQSGHPGARRRR
jgi:hypothetical protein